MKAKKPIWGTVAALAAEGFCQIGSLLFRFLEIWWIGRLPTSGVRWEDGILLLLAAGRLLTRAPFVISRQALYRDQVCSGDPSDASLSPFFRALRYAGPAIAWRWRLWLRRTAALAFTAIPAVLVWGYGSRVWADTGTQILFLLAGGGLLFLGWTGVAVWQCRYALAPLFLLEGYPAGAALQLSARAMRRRKGDYINFLGRWVGRLALCLLLIPAPVLIPRFHREQTKLLLSFRRQAAFPPVEVKRVAK